MIWKIDLAWIADQMGLLPCRTFCECAVGPMEISVAPGFKKHCNRMLLVEPHPTLAGIASAQLKEPIIKAAIGFNHAKGYLCENNGSSALRDTWCPTPATSLKQYPVTIITFDSIDDGVIDILALDCEGMEWAVLSKMHSKPKLLTIEIWNKNPYKQEIYDWLKTNNYSLRFSTGPETETQLYTLD